MTYTPEQQAANRAKWVEALRSGKYKQGKSLLRLVNEDRTVSYCCLGVACEISGLSDWDGLTYCKVCRAYTDTVEVA